MKNLERIQIADAKEMAKIIRDELCGMCRACNYYYTISCLYDEKANEVNPGACEKGIEEWLNSETEESKNEAAGKKSNSMET